MTKSDGISLRELARAQLRRQLDARGRERLQRGQHEAPLAEDFSHTAIDNTLYCNHEHSSVSISVHACKKRVGCVLRVDSVEGQVCHKKDESSIDCECTGSKKVDKAYYRWNVKKAKFVELDKAPTPEEDQPPADADVD